MLESEAYTWNCCRALNRSRPCEEGKTSDNVTGRILATFKSIGSVSTFVVADLTKKLNESFADPKNTLSSDKIPNLLLKKKVDWIGKPIKDGIGLVTSSPVFLSVYVRGANVNAVGPVFDNWCGMVDALTPGEVLRATVSCQ